MDNINPSATTNYLTPPGSGGAASPPFTRNWFFFRAAIPATSIDAVLSRVLCLWTPDISDNAVKVRDKISVQSRSVTNIFYSARI